MSLADSGAGPAGAAPSDCANDVAGLYRLPVYTACTLAALLGSWLVGKDLLADTLNYHLYAGFSALHDRFAQDYFAAGPGAYFNPYVYVPFYALVSTGLPALAIASLLAVVHSTLLWLTYEIALCASPSTDRGTCVTAGAWAVALGFLNPVLIGQLGSSYADVTTATLVLLGWLLLVRAVRAPRAALPVFAGVALGAACAFKLTNAVHAVAAGMLILMLPWPGTVLRYGVRYVAALALSFALVAGPWALHLARNFGNPFFPLLNNVFRSPDFITAPLRHLRFVPADLAAALWRPFAIANPVPMVQVEQSAPDLRYALLLVLGGVLLVRWPWKHRSRPSCERPAPATTRILVGLGCGLALDWALWLTASGNGRYFLPMAAIAAVLLVALLYREGAAFARVRTYVLAAVVVTQAVALFFGAEYRPAPVPWEGAWFKVQVPAHLAGQANLYLTLGVQSNSFLAPYLPPGSGLINITGIYPLSARGAPGSHIQALIRRFSPHVRVLLHGARLYQRNEQGAPQRATVDYALAPFGLRVDPGECTTIVLHGMPRELESLLTVGTPPASHAAAGASYLLTCQVVADDVDHAADLKGERTANRALANLERACPALFQPTGLTTQQTGSRRWQRLYVNTDLEAWVSDAELRFIDPPRGDDPVDLGRESDWTKAPQPVACGRRDGHYFARRLTE